MKRIPIFSVFLFFLPVLVALGLGGQLLGRDPDLAVHIAYGRAVLAQGPWLIEDPTILSGGAPVLHEWLTEAGFALVDRYFGLGPFILFAALVQSVIVTHVFRRGLTYGFWSAWVSALVAFGAMATAFTVRPHLLSWLGFYLLLATRGQPRRWGVVLIMGALWVNLHVMALLLVVVLACELITTRRGIRPLLAAVVAMVCNPWGIELWHHGATVALGPNPAQDCAPPDFWTTGTAWVYLPLAGLALAALWQRRGADPTLALLLVGTVAAAGLQMRNLPYCGMVLALYVQPALQRWLARLPDSFNAGEGNPLPIPALVRVVLVLLVAASFLRPSFQGPYVPPTSVQSWAQGPGYAHWNASGYLVYAGHAQHFHSLNANVADWSSLYADQQVLDRALAGWAELLDDRAAGWVLTRRGDPLDGAVQDAMSWRLVVQDGPWRMYVRTVPLATR